MSRLIDDLRRELPHRPRVVAPDYADLWRLHAIKIQRLLTTGDPLIAVINGVAIYYFETNDQEFWDLGRSSDFPNLIPPRPLCWFEYRMPSKIVSWIEGESHDVTKLCPDGSVGILVAKLDRDRQKGEDIPPNCRTILWCEVFVNYGPGRGIQGPHASIFIALDDNGEVIGNPSLQCFFDKDDRKREEAVQHLLVYIHPALLALSWIPEHLPEEQMEIAL